VVRASERRSLGNRRAYYESSSKTSDDRRLGGQSEPEPILLCFYFAGGNAEDSSDVVPSFESTVRLAITNDCTALLRREIQDCSQFISAGLVHVDAFKILLRKKVFLGRNCRHNFQSEILRKVVDDDFDFFVAEIGTARNHLIN